MKINEITVNYNHLKNLWVLRKDAVNGKFFPPSGEVQDIILQDASPVIDWKAVDKGARVFAFVQGDKTNSVPNNYIPRAIKFVRNEHTPFVHIDNGSAFEHADFVEFNSKGAFAYYSKQVNEDGRIVKGVNTTADVGTDEIKKQAEKFGNKVDKDGRPPQLSKKVKGSSTNVLFNLGLTNESK